jgi:TolB-like protein
VYTSQIRLVIAQTHARLGEVEPMITWLRRLFTEPSQVPFTPASLRIDPRFNHYLDDPRVAALLDEFASLDAPAAVPVPDRKSIAVLPFANLSSDKENEFFADGLHDDVITSLAKIRDLKVISRTSVLAYRDTAARNLKKIAADLGVATVLEGSVRRVGAKVHMNAQLIDARTDEHLWADTFDGDATDVFALQAKLAQQIAAALKATLTPGEKTLIERRPTENREAYELYLRARARQEELGETASLADYERVLALYGQVLALDPNFALADVQITYVNSILYWFGYLDPSAGRAARVKTASEAAVRLAPDAPETHLAIGLYQYRVLRRWDEALDQFRTAQAGLPNDGQLAFLLAITLRRMGRWTEALDSFDRTLELNPRDLTAVQNALQFNVDCRRFDVALRLLDRTAGFFPDLRDLQLARARAKFARDNDITAFAGLLASAPVDVVRYYGPVDQYRAAIYRGDLEGAERLVAGETREALADVLVDNNAVPIPTALYRAEIACLRGDAAAARTNAAKAEAYYRQGSWNDRQVSWVRMQNALASAFAGGGLAAAKEAEAALAETRARDAYDAAVMQTEVAWVEVLGGRRDAAFAILQDMMRMPATLSPNDVRADPILSRLKDDPRFEEILTAAKPL